MRPFSLTSSSSLGANKNRNPLARDYLRETVASETGAYEIGFWRRFRRGASRNSYLKIKPVPSVNIVSIIIKPDQEEQWTILLPIGNLKYYCLKLSDNLRIIEVRGASVTPMTSLDWWLEEAKAYLVADPCIHWPTLGTAKCLIRTSGRQQRKKLSKDLKILDLFSLGPKIVRREAWTSATLVNPAPRSPTCPKMTLRIGVVVHLHYTDVWSDIEGSLRAIPQPFGLIVTLTNSNSNLGERIKQAFPFADIRIVQNSGRDVRPFLELLDEGAFDQFDIVCKLHGKKSIRDGETTALGELWRRSALYELIGGPGRFAQALGRFENNQSLGLLGPERFRLPNEQFTLHDAWSGNREETLRIAEWLNLPKADELDFFAGTMFWFRPAALAPLREAELSDPQAYALEQGRTDGAVEHALERLFATSAKAAGFTIDDLPPFLDALYEVS